MLESIGLPQHGLCLIGLVVHLYWRRMVLGVREELGAEGVREGKR